MTNRERKILLLAAAIGVVFAITQGFPALQQKYAQNKAGLEQVQANIDRENRLLEDSDVWQERRLQTQEELVNLQMRTIQEGTVPLISANIQRVVREHANRSGISITSTKLAESMRADGWLLVEQELSIQTENQGNVLGFLRSVENSNPKLGITAFSLRRNRNQYSGTITVVGFSRVGMAEDEKDV